MTADDELLDHLRRTRARQKRDRGTRVTVRAHDLTAVTEVVARHQQVADTKGREGASMFWRTGGGYRNPPTQQGEPTQ